MRNLEQIDFAIFLLKLNGISTDNEILEKSEAETGVRLTEEDLQIWRASQWCEDFETESRIIEYYEGRILDEKYSY
jgi:hypothetical protein